MYVLTIDILEELRLIEELWDELLHVKTGLVDVAPSARNREKLTICKIKPKSRNRGEIINNITKKNDLL